MEQENADVQPEKTDAEPVKRRSCVLEIGAEGVRFIVDGQVAKILPLETYETFHKKLTRGLEFNIYPLVTPDGAEIRLQLLPLSEIRAGPVELRSPDGVTYGRQYKLMEVKREADGKSCAIVALADTGEVIEQEPWEDFKRRVTFRRCRGGTAYRKMLGEFNPRLYFDVTGQIYKPEEEKPKDREPEAAAKKAPGETARKAEEQEPRGEDPLLQVVAAGREWLRENPRYGYIAAAVFLLVLAFGVVRVWRGPDFLKSKPPQVSLAVRLDYHLNQEYEIARALGKVDFVRYARKNPEAARQSVENLAAFVEKNRSTPGLTPAQTEKMRFISDTVQRLQADLATATGK
jgi:hypothetical protein